MLLLQHAPRKKGGDLWRRGELCDTTWREDNVLRPRCVMGIEMVL